jgi:hypothetical protein
MGCTLDVVAAVVGSGFAPQAASPVSRAKRMASLKIFGLIVFSFHGHTLSEADIQPAARPHRHPDEALRVGYEKLAD